jgi:sugar phosphate isomerase/epimerase
VFGVNLSFCVKRWVTPELWAPIVREDLGLEAVQLSFDLVDPLWPDDVLDGIAADLRAVPSRHGVAIHSAFIGLAHYTFNQLLHPDPKVRDAAEAWLVRAYRFAATAGISRVGGPLGAVAARRDAKEPEAIPEADYADLVTRMLRLAGAAREHGLVELYVEPTPLRREWPWTVAQARRMLTDVAAAVVPWKLCIDWGHALFEPVYGSYRARMEPWLDEVGDAIGVIHLQQTDGRYDRHWDFTEAGSVSPQQAAALLEAYGLADRPVFLEVFYPFERDDRSVLEAVRRSVAALRSVFV